MELRELNPFTNNYTLPITRYTSCILKQEYLGIANLPLISKLNMCGQLLVSIDREVEAIGPDGTTITVKPLGRQLSRKKLLARTPLTAPTRTNNWVPPRINSEQILDYAKYMNILVEEDKEVQLNILPHPVEELVLDGKLVRIKEGGLTLHEDVVEEQVENTSKIKELRLTRSKVRYNYKNFTITLKTVGHVSIKKIRYKVREGLHVSSNNIQLMSLENMLYVNTDSLIVEHDYYNVRTRYLQPLGFIEEELSRATITSPITCIEPFDQNSMCIVSNNPITLDFYPGKILVFSRSPLHVLFSKRMFEWGKALSILWSTVNKPIRIKAMIKTILWRITPYSVKPLYFKTESISNRRVRIKLMLWNSTNRLVQADIWFPGKIVWAKTLDYGFREVEELIPDYDRVKASISPLGVSIVELELLRLPPLLLRELMRRSMLSPYTPP